MKKSLPDPDEELGGLFSERPNYIHKDAKAPKPLMRFAFVPVKHDHGLAFIYGSALGAWAYMAAYGLLALPAPDGLWDPTPVNNLRLIAAGIGVVVGGMSIHQFVSHDRNA